MKIYFPPKNHVNNLIACNSSPALLSMCVSPLTASHLSFFPPFSPILVKTSTNLIMLQGRALRKTWPQLSSSRVLSEHSLAALAQAVS